MTISVVSLLNRPPPTGVWHHLRETAGALPAHIRTLVSPSSRSQTAGHLIFLRACDRPRGKRTGSKRIPTGSRRERAIHRHLPGKLEAWRASLPYVCLPDPGCAPTIWVTTAVPKRYRPSGEPSDPWADVLNGSHLSPLESPPKSWSPPWRPFQLSSFYPRRPVICKRTGTFLFRANVQVSSPISTRH